MSTKYIASNWRLPNEENSNKSDNYGLDFSGSNAFINCGNVTELNGASKLTFNLWIKYDSTLNFQVFLGQNVTSSTDVFQIYNWGSGILYFWINTGGVGTVSYVSNFSSLVNIDEWHMLTAVYDGTQASNNDRLSIYLDGGSTNIITNYGTIPTTYPNTTDDFLIGKGISGDFNGKLSELSIFNYTLSESQISTLYGSSSLGAGNPMALKPQPVAFYPLGDNSASNPLTQPNEAVEDASVFDFVSSSSQYIDCGDNDDFSFGNGTTDEAFSVSAWIKMDTITNFVVLSKYGASVSLREYAIGFSPDKIYLLLYDDNGAYRGRYYNTSTTSNDWLHIATTYNGVGGTNAQDGIKIYINGTRVDDSTYSSGSYTAMSNTTSELRIGSFSTTYADGKISNAQIWNTELTSSEVTTLYNSGVPLLTGTQPQASNLKAWYKLDQSANWEADSSGDWQIPDAVSAYPQSFDFDGSNDLINCGNDSSLAFVSDVSVSAWIKTTETTGAIAGKQYYRLEIISGKISWAVYRTTSNGVFLNSTSLVNDGKWHHIVVTHKASENQKVYVDGQLEATATANTSILTSTQDFFIGRRNATHSRIMNGNISNVQVWGTELSSTQVETLYNNGTPLTTAIASDNLKAWYKLDNTATFSTNWSVPDASGNGNTGTSSGMTEQNLVNNNVSALNGESSGMTSANLVLTDLTRNLPYDSYSFDLDGTDFINCGNFTGVNNSPTASWCGWFKPSGTTGGTLFSQWSATTSDQSILFSLSTSLTRIDIYLNTNIAFRASGGSALMVQDEWNFVCLTFNKDNTAADRLQLYINNSRVTETTGFVGPNANINNSTADFLIAGYYTTTQEFLGNISNFTIFNEELTSTEMLKLYANGVPQDLTNFTPQPQAWWPLGSNSFWNGSAWTVRDMSTGGSNDGTGQNIGIDGLVGDSPRSSANGTGTNMDVPTNLEGSTKWSENNSWSINMSSTARVEDTP